MLSCAATASASRIHALRNLVGVIGWNAGGNLTLGRNGFRRRPMRPCRTASWWLSFSLYFAERLMCWQPAGWGALESTTELRQTAHAKAKPFEIGGGPQEGSHGNAESQGTMAHQHEQHCLQSAERPLAEGARSSRDEGYLDQTALWGRLTARLHRLIGTAGCGPACPVVWEG